MQNFESLTESLSFDLQKIDEIILGYAKGKSELIQEISSHIISSGGKRIRPVLHILSAKLCSSFSQNSANSDNIDLVENLENNSEKNLQAFSELKSESKSNTKKYHYLASAIELIHTATLLHDDVVDASQTRRGKKTANSIWDNKASILVGDFLFSLSFQMMVKTQNMLVLDLLAKTSSIIADGEVMQLQNSNNIDLKIEKYYEIIFGKTAALFSASCESAALIYNSSDKEKKALSDFGKNLGMIFQIVDDILDYSANEKTLGKDIGNDFFEGKVTLPIILTYQNSSSEERSFIADIFAKNLVKNEKNLQEFSEIMSLINKNKGLEESKNLAKNFHKTALNNLKIFPDSPLKQNLITVLNYSIERIF